MKKEHVHLPKKKSTGHPEIISNKGIAVFAFVGVILLLPSLYLFTFSKTYDNFSEFQYHLIDIWPHVFGSVIIPPYIYIQNKSLRKFTYRKYRDFFYNMLCF